MVSIGITTGFEKMISHRYKCIFIHITKCAGSSVEEGLGLPSPDPSQADYAHGFGWCPERKIYMQHATPQQLLATGLIDQATWESYYKFIIVRNPWDRACSDYFWLMRDLSIHDSFTHYIKANGAFRDSLTKPSLDFRGDHLNPQRDYFFLHDAPITYDRVVRFEALAQGLAKVDGDLRLPFALIARHKNQYTKKLPHYSHFYTKKRKILVQSKFHQDITFLNYSFEDNRTSLSRLKALAPTLFYFGIKKSAKLMYPELYYNIRKKKDDLASFFSRSD